MDGYDPEVHKVDPEKWSRDKNNRGARVTIDRWTKDGKSFVNLCYWARKGPLAKDEYRVNIVAPTLEEAIYRAERRELSTVLRTVAPDYPF